MIWSIFRHVASFERAQPDSFACGAALVTRNPETAFGAAFAKMMAQHQFNKLMRVTLHQ